jgi:hypothetical protein
MPIENIVTTIVWCSAAFALATSLFGLWFTAMLVTIRIVTHKEVR